MTVLSLTMANALPNNRMHATRRSAPQRTGVQGLAGFCLNISFQPDVRAARVIRALAAGVSRQFIWRVAKWVAFDAAVVSRPFARSVGDGIANGVASVGERVVQGEPGLPESFRVAGGAWVKLTYTFGWRV